MSKAVDELFIKNLDIIKYIAKKYSTLDPAISYEDLLNEAYIAIAESIEKFESEKKVSYSSYLWWCLKKRFQKVLKKDLMVVEIEDNTGEKAILNYNQFMRKKVFLKGKKWRVISLNESLEGIKEKWDRRES